MKLDLVIIIVGVALLGVVWIGWSRFSELREVRNPNDSIVCTADAKLCPDGSYVGRIGPHCEFARCPGSSR